MKVKFEKYLANKPHADPDPEIENLNYPRISGAIRESEKVAREIFDKAVFRVQLKELDRFVRPFVLQQYMDILPKLVL